MCRGPLQSCVHCGVCGLRGGAVPGQRRAVTLLGVSCWLSYRYADRDRRGALHGVRGGAVQRCGHVGVRTMCSGLRDRYPARLRCGELHGVCGGTVQLGVDIGVRVVCAGVGDGHIGKWRCEHVQCLCGGAVQRGVDAGVCRLCGGAVSGPGRAVALLGVWCGRGDGYAVGCGCGELHGVCGGRVQCAVDVGVCSVRTGLCDQ